MIMNKLAWFPLHRAPRVGLLMDSMLRYINEDETVACLQMNVKEGECYLDLGWGSCVSLSLQLPLPYLAPPL